MYGAFIFIFLIHLGGFTMKKKTLSLIALTLMIVMALVSCGGTKLTMGTGGTGGTYYGFGAVISQYIEKNA